MTYGCGAEGCLSCYPLQYECADCATRWENPVTNGEQFTCPECDYINNEKEEAVSWSELAELTHATQVERFNFCLCEEQEQFPYSDCPRPVMCGDCIRSISVCGCLK